MAAQTKTKVFSSKTTPEVPKDPPLIRRRDGSTNYVAWREFTTAKLGCIFPTVCTEFLINTPIESHDELVNRVSAL